MPQEKERPVGSESAVMGVNNVGLITTSEMAAILTGAAIAHATVVDRIRTLRLNRDKGSYLTLYANALDELARIAPNTRTEEVLRLTRDLLMETEIGAGLSDDLPPMSKG